MEEYAHAERISPADAAAKLIQTGLEAKRRKAATENLVTDEQIEQLKALDGTFGLLEDVPEEQIDRMAATIRRMKRESLLARAKGFARQHRLDRP